jgi:hypothetical protein
MVKMSFIGGAMNKQSCGKALYLIASVALLLQPGTALLGGDSPHHLTKVRKVAPLVSGIAGAVIAVLGMKGKKLTGVFLRFYSKVPTAKTFSQVPKTQAPSIILETSFVQPSPFDHNPYGVTVSEEDMPDIDEWVNGFSHEELKGKYKDLLQRDMQSGRALHNYCDEVNDLKEKLALVEKCNCRYKVKSLL